MGRKPRVEVEGGLHHVYARGVDRQRIFRDDVDRSSYLTLLGTVIRKTHWRCMTFCLMENHVHLLLETPEPNLGQGMRLLQSSYARAFNVRHGRTGHLFQGRFGSVLIRTDAQLWAVVSYIARNPIEAGLCEALDQWPWSSHQALLGGPGPNWLDVPHLLSHFEGGKSDARSRYRELVMNGLRGTEVTDPV
jgi:putative transposase